MSFLSNAPTRAKTCVSSMTPQERHLLSAVAEHIYRLVPERFRLGMRAVIIATSGSRRICRALMRHHCVVPRRKARGESQRYRGTNGMPD